MDAETQVAGFFARYEPAMARLGKALRAKLRHRLPGLNEIVYVYESQESLVIAYSPTEGGGGSGAVCSLAVYPREARLYFTQVAALSKLDPKKLLQGSAGKVRYVVLSAVTDFDRPEIEVWMAAVLKLAKVRLDPGAKGSVIIKADSQKKRAAQRKRRKR